MSAIKSRFNRINTGKEEVFSALLAKKTLPQAVLLVGERDLGKKNLAKDIAASLLCPKNTYPCDISQLNFGGCCTCQDCTLVEMATHPDLHVVDYSVSSPSAGELREIIHNLKLKPFRALYRVLLLLSADRMNKESANALLKSLEEPNDNVQYILTAENASRLPNTILSRCQRWSFSRMTDSRIKKALADRFGKLSTKDITLYLAIVQGKPNRIELAEELLPDAISIQEKIDSIIGGNVLKAIAFAKDLALDKEGFEEKFAILMELIRLRMLATKDRRLKSRLSFTLMSLISAQTLVSDYRVNLSYLLSGIFVQLSSKQPILALQAQRELALYEEL